jgi:predicted TIM-barrel fold metal-dependent hydrolase
MVSWHACTPSACAARFNFGGNFKLAPSLTTFRRSLERIRELGWFAKIFGFGDDFLTVAEELRKISGPAMIDHMDHEFERIGLLERCLPTARRDRVLVDNPARLFAFA